MERQKKAGLICIAAVTAALLLAMSPAFTQERQQPPGQTAEKQYNVGYRLLKLPMEDGEPLVVALWYPTEAQATSQKYVPVIPYLEGKVAVDAPPAKGPFPLVVFSHGGIGAGICAMAWAEALAAEGFVVAAPDHKDEVSLLRSDAEKPPTREQTIEALRWAMKTSRTLATGSLERNEYEHRPPEIRATIDYLLKQSADETSPLHGLVNPDRIGLTGVSFGSWTALAVAGGVAAYHDPRIKAVIPMAPEVGKTDRAQIHVPIMTIFGEKETLVLLDKRPDAPLKFEGGVKSDYEKANPPKFLAGIKGAEHLDFDADGMTTRASLKESEEGDVKVYSTAEVRENDPVIRTIVRYQLAFWRRYLLDDRDAEKILTTKDEEDVYVFMCDLGAGEKEPIPPIGDELEKISPADAGMDGAKLDEAMEFAGKHNSKGVVVLRGGKIVAEKYWDGWNEKSTSDMCSAQKSMTSVLIGIALDEKLIKDLDQGASDYLKEWKGTPKEKITLRHMLAMISGLSTSRKSDLFDALRSDDQTAFALALEQAHPPGTVWAYNNPAYTLVNTILERATGKTRQEYANEKLFKPLGMTCSKCGWNTLSERFGLKHDSISSSCRDMARFGQFVLQGGRWKDRQIVSKEYLTAATKKSQELNPAYGYLWWLNGSKTHMLPYEDEPLDGMLFPDCPPDTIAALGAKDSKIYVIPSLDLVVTRLGEAAMEGKEQMSVTMSEFDNPFLSKVCAAVGAASAQESGKKTFNVGLKIIDFTYERPDGGKETLSAAVWYPTEEKTSRHVYKDYESKSGEIESNVALDAAVAPKAKPCPLIFFAHGAYGCGYNSAFFMEYLASRGYICVAPDFADTKPPDYKEQIAFSRIKDGNTGHPMRILTIAGRFIKDMSEDRKVFLSYLAEHRLNQTSSVIDQMLKLNRSADSAFNQAVREDEIGICGHSLGGATVLSKIGANPDEKFEDDRIKAALVFSAPAYPYEDTAGSIDIPVMLMAGDNDQAALHPELPRRLTYDKANAPKFYLVLKDATHFDFGNEVCGDNPLNKGVETVAKASAACRYGLAFFDKFLRKDATAGAQLDKTDEAWAYYIKEEKKGDVKEWGKEPPPGKEDAQGGLRERIRKELEGHGRGDDNGE